MVIKEEIIKKYNLPLCNVIEIIKKEDENYCARMYLTESRISDIAGIASGYDSLEEVEDALKEYLIDRFTRRQKNLLEQASELEKIASTINKKGLEEAEKHYQTLQNKKMEGGN